ncbi:AmmeMemoRadiSam system protein B [Candidatus Woesearchaeota archaeon]|nr:AmmeMemoRadiSam system protein B [Candidatus Woesearchaeota archaeon]
MARHPAVSGQFYESSPKKLQEQIKSCFLSRFGPGSLPERKDREHPIGIISPHAGYMYCGACQAHGFKELAESRLPETFLILGLSHGGYPTCVSLEDWETPLGKVQNDTELQKSIMDDLSIPVDEAAHAAEHSLEVQVPFLQFIAKNNIKIAPLIVSPDLDFKKIAQALHKVIKKDVVIITSSDFTHYGLNYGYSPFSENIKENMYKLDQGALDFIRKLDAAGFLQYTVETGATICGKYPIAVFLEFAKLRGAKKAELLKYYTSGDVVEDYSSAVGYASVKII